ncbi:hypothetical protein ACM26W_05990 [Halomonas sp. HK25]|uniref:Cap15 family cyclic dinucleotide receptor domain-containing protein n=1 Tax=Halomonas sp. HK25 TaxID=3394321 RepID=UPI0039FD897E
MLHTYSVNDVLNAGERIRVLYKVAAVSSVISGSLGGLLGWLTSYWGAAAITAPATIIVYLMGVKLVEHHLWKNKWSRLFLGISLPNINGCWSGTIETRRRDGEFIKGNTGVMTVAQTWSTIGIEFETNKTSSYSTGAFFTQGASHLVLTMEYQADVAEPHWDDDDIHAHKGTAKFRVPLERGECDLSEVKVPYYTDHRETGIIHLKKLEPNKENALGRK